MKVADRELALSVLSVEFDARVTPTGTEIDVVVECLEAQPQLPVALRHEWAAREEARLTAGRLGLIASPMRR